MFSRFKSSEMIGFGSTTGNGGAREFGATIGQFKIDANFYSTGII